jgi:hypothetical protein
MPGRYTVRLAIRQADGSVRDIGEEVFDAAPPAALSATVATSADVQAFRVSTARLQRAVLGANALLGETVTRVRALEAALPNAWAATDSLARDVRALAQQLEMLGRDLVGDNTAAERREPTPVGLLARLNDVVSGHWGTQQAPTVTQRQQVEIVTREAPPLLARLRELVTRDLPAVEARAEAAGVPWTPGRIPSWP